MARNIIIGLVVVIVVVVLIFWLFIETGEEAVEAVDPGVEESEVLEGAAD